MLHCVGDPPLLPRPVHHTHGCQLKHTTVLLIDVVLGVASALWGHIMLLRTSPATLL